MWNEYLNLNKDLCGWTCGVVLIVIESNNNTLDYTEKVEVLIRLCLVTRVGVF